MGVRAKPMMAKRRARQFCAARPYSAGTSLRRARSPEAPKMTRVQGSAGEMELCLVGSAVSITALLLAVMFGPSLFRGRFDGVAAKLIPHRGQQLVGIGIGIARRQPLQERQRDDGSGSVEIDGLGHCPAAFSRIRNVWRDARHLRIVLQRDAQ